MSIRDLLRSSWPLHASRQIDLAFVVDCTQSMRPYIVEVQQNIQRIVTKISRVAYDTRYALIQFRDHPPQETSFVVECLPFTKSVPKITGYIGAISAAGGGDDPDAVADGLYKALSLDYRPQATKICIFIGDARPHGLHQHGDEFPKGCPLNHDPIQICREMAVKGIILCCVECESSFEPFRDFFMGLTLITGGQYVFLSQATLLPQIIVLLTCEEVENENLMGHVEDHIHLELQGIPKASVDQLAHSLNKTLPLSNNRLRRRIKRNRLREIEPFTDGARQISSFHRLAEAAAVYREEIIVERIPPGPEDNVLTSIDITDLDNVRKRLCWRLVRRSSARNGQRARGLVYDVEME